MEFALNLAKITLKGKAVMILGSGGTSLTAVYVCQKQDAKSITVVSRTGEINYENCYNQKETEVIINTTPVGTYPNCEGDIIDLSRFEKLEGVFDCVYNPIRTNLILSAQKLGIKCANGLSMLVAQALKSEEIWLEKEFGEQEYIRQIKEFEKQKTNIILVGMPSSGKSTIAKILGQKTGKSVYDTDEEICKRTGKTSEEIILSDGESRFREIESEIISFVMEKRGAIIATGGGSILLEKNRKEMKRNGNVYYVSRALENLTEEGRPLSKNGAISRLFKEREPIYKEICDKKIENDGDLEQAVREILENENFSY
jgi:shikimate dehydrogenase